MILSENFDIFALSETWLSDLIDSSLINIPGYQFIRCDRKSRGGGIALYLKNNIKFSKIQLEANDRLEQLWISCKINKQSTAIGVLYNPPDNPYHQMVDGFEESISHVLPTHATILCCGDINIDLLKDTPTTSDYLSKLKSFELRQLMNEPTRITPTSATLVDHIITNVDLEQILNRKAVDVPELSDHHLTYINIKFDPVEQKNEFIIRRNLNNINYMLFDEDAKLLPWSNIYKVRDINEKINILNKLLLDLFDRHAPLHKSKVKKINHNPWITDSIKHLINEKNIARLSYIKYKTLESRKYYCSVRNVVCNAIKRERQNYFKSRFNTCGNSTTKMWAELKKIGCQTKTKSKQQIPDNLADAEKINRFFIDNIPQLQACPEYIKTFQKGRCSKILEDLKFELVNQEIIKSTLLEIKTEAYGVDDINTKMLKIALPHCLDALTHIINVSMETGIVPDIWKFAIINPISKVAAPKEFKDLRPISILATSSKILEKIVYKQIVEHLSKYDVLPDCQSGFRKGYSTNTALINVLDDISKNNDDRNLTVLTLLDMSKAFDSVNLDLLYNKLNYYGLRSTAAVWIKNYLFDRYQVTRISRDNLNEFSTVTQVSSGVPQGSILGPLLFSIYVADLTKYVQNCKVITYADDIQLYFSFSPKEAIPAVNIINSELNQIVSWTKNNALLLNPNKTKIILFGSQVDRTYFHNLNTHIQIENIALSYSDVVLNLGVKMDANLTFNDHINNLIRGSFIKLKCLYQYKKVIPAKIKLKLADSLVLSRLNYCDSAYGPYLTDYNKKRLQRVQNQCVRFAFGIPRIVSVKNKILEIGWLDMDKRRHLHMCCLYQKIIKTGLPAYLFSKIKYTKDIHSVNTRQKNSIQIPKHKTEAYKSSFQYSIANVYNNLKSEFKTLSIESFKKKIKRDLLC